MINTKPTFKTTLRALGYLAPLLIIIGVFTVWPLIHALLLSTYTKYNYYTNQVQAVGLDNFNYLWHDPDFHQAVRNTLVLVFVVVPVTVLLSLGIALLINRITRLAHFFQTLYFLPFVTSTVAIAMVWNWILYRNGGLLNTALGWIGIRPIDWLNDPRYSLVALMMMCIWQGLGFNIILFLAGLNNLDQRYYAAARMDGATGWQVLTNLTWPLLLPMTVLVTVNTMIINFKVFDQVYVLFHGSAGPADADMTMIFYLYQKFYVENQFAIAAASGVVLFILLALITGLGAWYVHHHYRRRGGDGR